MIPIRLKLFYEVHQNHEVRNNAKSLPTIESSIFFIFLLKRIQNFSHNFISCIAYHISYVIILYVYCEFLQNL